MYFRLQGYPSPHLIVRLSYSISNQKPPAKTSLTSGTSPLVWVGSGVPYFHCQRRTTDAAHQHQIMETLTITNNGATIQMMGTYAEIANFLLKFDTTAAPVANSEPAELEPFNTFLTKELASYFTSEEVSLIVTKLKRSYAIGDFRYFIPVYKLAKNDLQKRQLLKVISASYRYKFGGHRNPEQYSLRSEIKYASACSHCGALASVLVDRLTAEGLWR